MINIDEFGALNRRIRIKAYGDAEDEFGIAHAGLTDVFPHRLWARIDPLRARAYDELDRDKIDNIVKFTIRYRDGITDRMFVEYAGRMYTIHSVIDPMMAHVKLELMCSLKEVKDAEN